MILLPLIIAAVAIVFGTWTWFVYRVAFLDGEKTAKGQALFVSAQQLKIAEQAGFERGRKIGQVEGDCEGRLSGKEEARREYAAALILFMEEGLRALKGGQILPPKPKGQEEEEVVYAIEEEV